MLSAELWVCRGGPDGASPLDAAMTQSEVSVRQAEKSSLGQGEQNVGGGGPRGGRILGVREWHEQRE